MAHGELNRQVLKLAIVLYVSKIKYAFYVGSTIEQKQETSVSKK